MKVTSTTETTMERLRRNPWTDLAEDEPEPHGASPETDGVADVALEPVIPKF